MNLWSLNFLFPAAFLLLADEVECVSLGIRGVAEYFFLLSVHPPPRLMNMSAEEADKTTTTDASAGDEEEEWLYGGKRAF